MIHGRLFSRPVIPRTLDWKFFRLFSLNNTPDRTTLSPRFISPSLNITLYRTALSLRFFSLYSAASTFQGLLFPRTLDWKISESFSLNTTLKRTVLSSTSISHSPHFQPNVASEFRTSAPEPLQLSTMPSLDAAVQEAGRLEAQLEGSQQRLQATRNRLHAIQQELETLNRQLAIDEQEVEADSRKLEAARAQIRLEELRMGDGSYHLEASTASTPARVIGFTNNVQEMNEIAERFPQDLGTDDLKMAIQARIHGKPVGEKVVKYVRRAPENGPEEVRGRLLCDDI
ncbi:hypothetical protein FIE12Z_5231 [Fusarium flagelliforme]|uniref:Uncharacterized protein n=1 Tax=Fusarium flagelliforme TaxID=2675880 RepID=A0A395MR68_9HYPO|nr:hypothetical protein FIE12Z_5231 [Fusarium flagelliforme]